MAVARMTAKSAPSFSSMSTKSGMGRFCTTTTEVNDSRSTHPSRALWVWPQESSINLDVLRSRAVCRLVALLQTGLQRGSQAASYGRRWGRRRRHRRWRCRGLLPNAWSVHSQWWHRMMEGYRCQGGFAPGRLGRAELGRSVAVASQRLASVCNSLNQELGRVGVLEIALLHA